MLHVYHKKADRWILLALLAIVLFIFCPVISRVLPSAFKLAYVFLLMFRICIAMSTMYRMRGKGKSGKIGFALGFLLGLIGVIIIMFIPDEQSPRTQA